MDKRFVNSTFERYHFRAMIGTGGIGSGSLFLLSGNHTLGREESRGGKYLDARDYCKLHIISHNVRMLTKPDFKIFPIGKIGDDDTGRSLFREMEQAGLDMKYVSFSPGDRTLFGFCFLYPDGTGGNLTTEESACSRIDSNYILSAKEIFNRYKGEFVSLAVPEVSLSARSALLELSKEYQGFSVASFTSGEISEARDSGMLKLVDLLAMNIDEACSLTGLDAVQSKHQVIVENAIRRMREINPSAMLSITFGKDGSWSWDRKNLSFIDAFPVKVNSSAGAGDAHLSAIIAGLTEGLSLKNAQILGNLAGALTATSPHTIHPDMNRKRLKVLALNSGAYIDPAIMQVLSD